VAAVHAVARVAIARRFVRRYDFVLVPPDGGPQALQVLAWQPKF
jgi:hypothetical protein